MNVKTVLLTASIVGVISGCVSSNDTKSESHISDTSPAMPFIDPVYDEPYDLVTQEELVEKEAQKSISSDSVQVLSKPLANHAKLKRSVAPMAEMAFHGSPALPAGHLIAPDYLPHYYLDEGRENYAKVAPGSVKLVNDEPVSTFSIDVDTGSYTNVRRILQQGSLPPADAVRIEEMINYFDYAYSAPDSQETPFSIHTELAESPWSSEHVLLKVGLKGYQEELDNRPASNLVFLLDVSGSMNSPDKLPLLKRSLLLLSKQLKKEDTVSIVVYAGASGVVLEPTQGNQTAKIERALEALSAGGSTNGQAGIELAYQLAKQNHHPEGINRVILATDGDFNVGTSDVEALKALIEKKRHEGISLTTLGFGTGNYNDHLMEQLADVGNGNYAYIDSFNEARKVLVEQLNATLLTIAKDVKIQIEFNPNYVKEYRLLGYENRALAREDFNNDKVDAGEIGAGHTVTAIYELALQSSKASAVDPLRYQKNKKRSTASNHDDMASELAFVKFRYKAPKEDVSQLISKAVAMPESIPKFSRASQSFRFSASVAQFGEVLRQSKYAQPDYETIIANATQAKGQDLLGYRSEFIQLVRLAANLDNS